MSTHARTHTHAHTQTGPLWESGCVSFSPGGLKFLESSAGPVREAGGALCYRTVSLVVCIRRYQTHQSREQGVPAHLTNSILLGAGRLVLVLRLVLADSQIGTQKADQFILTRGVSHEPRASAGDLSFGGRSWDGRRRSLL